MADFKKLNWMGARLKPTSRVTYEDIDPGSGWANDPDSPFHQLLLNLPGFKRSDIKLQVYDSGTITISGERRVSEYKRVRFQKTFKAPEDSDTKKISMQFEGVTLEVSIPREAKKRKEEPQIKNGASSSKDVKEEQGKKVQNVVSSSELRDDKRQESEITKEAEKNKSAPVIGNGALSSDLRDTKAAKNESLEDENVKEEPKNKNGAPSSDLIEETKIKNGALSSDLRKEKREEFESLEETKEMKEEPEIKNEGSSNDIREEKREEFESSEEAKEMKEESKFNNGALSKDKREESERPNKSKVTEENPVIEKGVPSETREETERSNQSEGIEEEPAIEKGNLSEKREVYESSKETKENKEHPESKIGALRSELIREEKKEESDSAKVAKENEEREIEKRDELGNSKDKNVEKPNGKNGNDQNNGHLIKGNDDSGHGNTSEDSVMEKIIKNRGILLASIISFTLGVLVSQKFHKPASK